jgi:hypothetical protein
MRAHGIALPPPNPNGSKTLFDLSGVHPGTPTYETAAATCRKAVGGLTL